MFKAILVSITFISYLNAEAFNSGSKTDSSKIKFAIGVGYKFGMFAPEKFWFNSERYPNFFLMELSRKSSTLGINYLEGYFNRAKTPDDLARMKRGDLFMRTIGEFGLYYCYNFSETNRNLNLFITTGLSRATIKDSRFYSYSPGHFEASFGHLYYKIYYLQFGGRVAYKWSKHFALNIDGAFFTPISYGKIIYLPGTDENSVVMKNCIRVTTGVAYTF